MPRTMRAYATEKRTGPGYSLSPLLEPMSVSRAETVLCTLFCIDSMSEALPPILTYDVRAALVAASTS